MTDAFMLWPTCWKCGTSVDVLQVGAIDRAETTTTAQCDQCGMRYALNVRMAPLGERISEKTMEVR